jgi:F420-dependent methylenetetrahydromethanopterin dehydrogenase
LAQVAQVELLHLVHQQEQKVETQHFLQQLQLAVVLAEATTAEQVVQVAAQGLAVRLELVIKVVFHQ